MREAGPLPLPLEEIGGHQDIGREEVGKDLVEGNWSTYHSSAWEATIVIHQYVEYLVEEDEPPYVEKISSPQLYYPRVLQAPYSATAPHQWQYTDLNRALLISVLRDQ